MIVHDHVPPAKRTAPLPFASAHIFLAVMRASGCSLKQLRSSRKPKSISDARAVAMWLLRNVGRYSFPRVGELLAKDHSSVQTACKVVDQQLRSGGSKAELLFETLTQMTKGT